MHIQFRPSFHSRTHSEAEARLCRHNPEQNLPDAEQSLKAGADMLANTHLQSVLVAHMRVINSSTFADETLTPADRANFFAFLTRDMLSGGVPLPGRPDYRGIARDRIRAADPFSIGPTMDENEVKRLNEIQESWTKNTEQAIPAELIERNIRKFLEWRNTLNGILRERNIMIPNSESVDLPATQNNLTRNEYFELMVLIKEGPIWTAQLRKISAGGIPAIRKFMAGTDMRPTIERYNIVRTDVTLDQMGPTEVLSRFGIVLGHILRHEYQEQRQRLPNGGPDAALWEERPMLAHRFLSSTQFSSLEGNRIFLDALQFYFDPSVPRDPSAVHRSGMREGDVRVILSQVVQSLLLSNAYAVNSAEQRAKLRNQLNVGQQIEKQAAQIGNYIMDLQNHPVGSVAVGLVAFLALRKAYRWIFKEDHYMITNLLGYGAIGGLAVGLYQQNRSGTAWWNDLARTIDRQRGEELLRNPNQRTVSSYWARECNLTDPRQMYCLSIMEEQPITQVLDWYRQKAVNPGANVPMPFQLGRFRNLFGESQPLEVQQLFFTTLKALFINRGQAARRGGWHLDLRNGLKTSAKLEQARAILRKEVPFYEKDRFFAPDINAATELLASRCLSELVSAKLLPSL